MGIMEVHDNTFGHLQMNCKRLKATFRLNVHTQIAVSKLLATYLLSLVMTTSVRLVCHQVKALTQVGAVYYLLTIPCGMVKVVVQLAHAAHSTIHHSFVNNYLSQLMLISKSDSAHLILHILTILR